MNQDLRPLFLPAYDGIGCETDCISHILHVKAPFDSGWKPGAYGHSRLFIQTMSNIDKTLGDDSPDGDDSLERRIATVMKYGTVPESFWPNTAANKRKIPPDSVLAQAVFPIKGYKRIGLDGISSVLAAKSPVAAKIPIFKQFRSAVAERTGRVPVGNTPPGSNHAMPIGFEDEDQFGFLNDWGLERGDKGWYYVYKSFLKKFEAQCRFYDIQFY